MSPAELPFDNPLQATSGTAVAAGNLEAGVFRRLAAGVYDALLVVALCMLATFVVVVVTGDSVKAGNPAFQALLFGVAAAFFIGFWLRGGQTLGMRAWRLKVVRRSGEPLDFSTACRRFAAGMLSIAPAGLGLFWLWLDTDGLPWHDRLAGTRVIVLPKANARA